MIRILVLALLVSSPLAAFAYDDFRCMATVSEPDGNYDLTFRGELQGTDLPTMTMELLAENGFYGEFDPKVTRYVLNEMVDLEIEGTIEGEDTTTFEIRAQYVHAVGNYQGEMSASENGTRLSIPVRCIYLRVI